jgi:hypothetical protein
MEYKQGLEKATALLASAPETIVDTIPPMPQEFVDKVHAEGGRITHRGIVYDQPKATQ